jgi:hypothetical protein
MREIRDALRAEKGFSVEHFPALHKPIHGQQPSESTTYADFLETGTLLGEQLRIHCDTFPSIVPSNTAQEQVYKDLQHLIADWIENMMHFFEVRFIDDEHEMIAVASKCMDLRLFRRLTLPGGQSLDNYLHNVVETQSKRSGSGRTMLASMLNHGRIHSLPWRFWPRVCIRK